MRKYINIVENATNMPDWLHDVQPIFDVFEGTGEEIMIAGGAVRSYLLNQPVNDVDFATTALPQKVIEIGEKAGYKIITVGMDHGTVILNHPELGDFEITTLRTDAETDGRHARVEFNRSFEQDAKRRDFTVNGLFMDRHGKIIDYVGGEQDGKQGRLRFIGSANERIQEDYLRILRYFRFLISFDSSKSTDPDTVNAIVSNKAGLRQLSAERIRDELFKIMKKLNNADVVELMKTMRVTDEINLNNVNINRLNNMIRISKDPLLRFMAMVSHDGINVDKMAEQFRLSNEQKKRMIAALRAESLCHADMNDHDIMGLLRLGRNTATDAIMLAKSEDNGGQWDRIMDKVQNYDAPQFPLRGKDLIDNGMNAGPEIGRALKNAETAWVNSGYRLGRDELLQYAMRGA